MISFCTYFNITYLTRGLALYYSLEKYCSQPFVLWILCFDDESYKILSELKLKHVRLITMAEFESAEPELKVARNNRTLVEFFWTCTPLLPLYIYKQEPDLDAVTYLDADLWFKSDPKVLLNELSASSVLIVGHRYSERYVGREAESGIYNVSWVTFKNVDNALECLNWWKNKCLDTCQLGGDGATCGDQKYLDEWPRLFKGVKELVNKGAGLAPWNLGRYNITNSGDAILVDNDELVFYHFHGFKQVGKYFVKPMDLHYCEDCNQVVFKKLYFAYAQELKRCYRQIANTGFSVPLNEIEVEKDELFDGLMLRAFFLSMAGWLAALVWKYGGWRYKRMINK